MTARMYRFEVDGQLREQARDAFADMRIEEVPPGLILSGPVIDESHLCGIIAQFEALGLSIVSAQPISD